jgi:hypothetical protein
VIAIGRDYCQSTDLAAPFFDELFHIHKRRKGKKENPFALTVAYLLFRNGKDFRNPFCLVGMEGLELSDLYNHSFQGILELCFDHYLPLSCCQ